ncbi:unnamed protein product [Cyclocybe aegerita]|uniref:DUF6830 domain-containing protein n=1 Tax=Cyclocybe aegerita TaxID=1973307 RepID=A0A8S0VZ46_CYCAE|nr:unnamed protein product [Cyclocybe aegerita]
MAKILLGCLVGRLPHASITAIRSLLENKQFFIDTGLWQHLNIPKFHSLLRYIHSIKLFGTTDNYNTEMFERLHIDFTKHGWCASNKRNEFPQMIRWLSQQEKISQLATYISAYFSVPHPTPSPPSSPGANSDDLHEVESTITIAKEPNFKNRALSQIEVIHNAPNFSYHLKQYLGGLLVANSSAPRMSAARTAQFSLPFTKVSTYNMFCFQPEGIQDDKEEHDIIWAIPQSKGYPHGRYDTAVVLVNDEAQSTGLAGMTV